MLGEFALDNIEFIESSESCVFHGKLPPIPV